MQSLITKYINMRKNDFQQSCIVTMLLCLLWILSPQSIVAQKFEIDGIWYSIYSEGVVGVISSPDKTKYSHTEIVLPEAVIHDGVEYAVTEIGDTAFYQCANLTSVTIPKSITNIASKAFYECTGLKSLTIADGNSALSFKNNYQFVTSPLESVYIGRDLEYTGGSRVGGNSPFVGTGTSKYSPIKTVVFSDSVTTIGSKLFNYCATLKTVIIGKNVTKIDRTAFAGCSELSIVECKAITPPSCQTSTFEKNMFATLYVPEGTLEAYQAAIGWKNFARIVDAAYIPDFMVDGIKYSVVGKSKVGVVAINDTTKYEGDIILPETVIYKGEPYTLTTICSGAFNQCWELNSVLIPATVTAIEKSAFVRSYPRIECKAATPPLCVIGSFSDASNTIYIPEGTLELYQTAIGWKDFTYIIDAAYVPDFMVDGIIYFQTGKETVGVKNHSHENGHPYEIVLPKTVTNKGITYRVVEIGTSAFAGCAHLESIVIPNSVTAIRPAAFDRCQKLMSIKLPENLTILERRAFSECYNLRKITIPKSIITIKEQAFEGCPIDSMTVKSMTPPKVESGNIYDLGNTHFEGVLFVPTGSLQDYMNDKVWNKFYKIEEKGGFSNVFEIEGIHYKMQSIEGTSVTVVGANGSNIIIPDSVVYDKKYAVIEIGNGAFSENKELESIVISEGITTLGNSAFMDCSNLRSISIPSTLVNGNFSYENFTHSNNRYYPAFHGCTGIESITVAEGHPYLDSRNNCNAIINDYGTLLMGCKTTIIPDGVTVIGVSAFLDTDIKEVKIPNSTTWIDLRAFELCDSLTSLYIGSGITKFGSNNEPNGLKEIFHGCYNLNTIVVDENNPLFDSRNNCNAIIETATNTILIGSNSTTIPEGVTAVTSLAFYNCHHLKSLYIPASLTTIPFASFCGCRNLESIVVDKANSVYDSRNNCNAIIETTTNTLVSGCMNTMIPEEVEFIGHYAFAECLGLKEIVIPDAVHTIGMDAFSGCSSLKVITFGKGLKCFESQPFGNN